MGSQSAQGMVEFGGVNSITMSWHLRSNHYPPVPSVMVAPCLAAVDALNEEDEDRLISTPEGVEFRDGRTEIPAWQWAESFHLWDFVSTGLELEL